MCSAVFVHKELPDQSVALMAVGRVASEEWISDSESDDESRSTPTAAAPFMLLVVTIAAGSISLLRPPLINPLLLTSSTTPPTHQLWAGTQPSGSLFTADWCTCSCLSVCLSLSQLHRLGD